MPYIQNDVKRLDRIFFGVQSDRLNYSEKVTVANTVPPTDISGKTFNFDSTNDNWVGFIGIDMQETYAPYASVTGYEIGAVLSGTKEEGETLGLPYAITVDRGFYIRGRAGFLLPESLLLYASVGWASYKGEGELEFEGSRTSGEIEFSGYEIGAGVEFLLSDHLSIRGEYNKFIHLDFDEPDAPPSPCEFSSVHGKMGLGLIWYFNLDS